MIFVADEDASGTILVCTTTDDSLYADRTTSLPAHCHPLINKDCTVAYGEAKIVKKAMLDALEDGITKGRYQFNAAQTLAPAHLQDIVSGLDVKDGIPLEERDLPVEVHRYAKDRGII